MTIPASGLSADLDHASRRWLRIPLSLQLVAVKAA
jgi:hypothetical protein